MMANINPSPSDRISLWILGAMLSLPFLVPVHTLPIATFYAQWLTGILGLAALVVLFVRSSAATVPSVALLPLVLIAVLLAQVAVLNLPYREAIWIAMIYHAWALLVMCVAASLKVRLGLVAVAETLAFCLLAGALANAVIGMTGFVGLESEWIAQEKRGWFWGNLAQKNNFGHHLWLGVASALFLAAQRRLAAMSFAGTLCLLLPAAALSGSRATLAYAAWILVAGLWWRVSGGFRRSLPTVAIFVCAAVFLPSWVGLDSSQTSWNRAWSEYDLVIQRADRGYGSGEGIRLNLLGTAWNMFLQAPWLGKGFGSFPWEAFGADRQQYPWRGIAEHPHNLVAQLMGEMGLAAALPVVLVLAVWAWRVGQRRNDPLYQWLGSLAGIGLIHALVEFPFWYTYFLGVFAVTLVLGDDRLYAVRFKRMFLTVIAVTGLFVAVTLFRDYRRLESLQATSVFNLDTESRGARNAAIVELRRSSLLKPFADMLLLAPVLPTRDHLADKLALCRLSLPFQPRYPAVFTCALLHELAGEQVQADRLWHQAVRAYPMEVDRYRETLSKLLSEQDRYALVRVLPI